MSAKICPAGLEEDERSFLRGIADGGKGSKERRLRARILLLADRGRVGGARGDAGLPGAAGETCGMDPEASWRQARGAGCRRRHLQGDGETRAEKNGVKPWLKKRRRIPPKANADFVCAMEDVLKTYARDFGGDSVLVCLDETSKQQTKETRTPLPARPGQPPGFEFECERNGTANLFMVTAPLLAWRHAGVTDRRTRRDFARVLGDIADVRFPGKKIVLVYCSTQRIPILHEA